MGQPGKNNSLFWGAILVLFGVLFLLDNFYFLDFGEIVSTYWPLILVAIGIKILLDHRRQKSEPENFGPEDPVDIHGGTSQADGISESNVFGDINLNITSEGFRGGSVSNVFGDMKIDISKIKLEQGTTKLIINGVAEELPIVDDVKKGLKYSTNTYLIVYRSMLVQVCREYNGLSDFRELTATEIRFFYNGLREELKRASMPGGSNGRRA